MRVGITCYPTHGGSGVVATELGKHLAGRGHEVAFIAYSTPLRLAELPPRVSFHEVDVVEYPLLTNFPYTLALASKMANVARMKRLQILHVHYAIPFAAAALLAKWSVPELDLKIVTTLHGTDVMLVGNLLLNRINRIVGRGAGGRIKRRAAGIGQPVDSLIPLSERVIPRRLAAIGNITNLVGNEIHRLGIRGYIADNHLTK